MRSIAVAFALLSFAALTTSSGCGLLEQPFSADTHGTISLPLGAMSAGCEGSGSEHLENGEIVSYTHRRVGEACVIDATWSGPLFDMDALRDDAEDRIRKRGVDPENVTIRITAARITVTDVSVRDARIDEAIPLDGLAEYRAGIVVGGDEIIEIATSDTGAPEVTVHSSDVLVELANEAYAERAMIEGMGGAHVVVDLSEVPAIDAAVRPALSIAYEIIVDGEATLAP